MTSARYGYLKYRQAPLFKVIVISWGIAFSNNIGNLGAASDAICHLQVESACCGLVLIAAVFVIFKKW
jgi:uncharacterized protein (DUF486 family)